ncbi:hypothetical protein [Campylobacter troglodytis]|uniref:hypothetical protein n=1 Tax=Campylobacter troglodytis TaxID=654363 RepID=UPI00115ABF7B|nr:hypothetical protein [Campylobacter troglodytis]TQR59615.1 hypothetical protein DMC01_07130 [Campylobacter troglodytis]
MLQLEFHRFKKGAKKFHRLKDKTFFEIQNFFGKDSLKPHFTQNFTQKFTQIHRKKLCREFSLKEKRYFSQIHAQIHKQILQALYFLFTLKTKRIFSQIHTKIHKNFKKFKALNLLASFKAKKPCLKFKHPFTKVPLQESKFKHPTLHPTFKHRKNSMKLFSNKCYQSLVKSFSSQISKAFFFFKFTASCEFSKEKIQRSFYVGK